jgi:hypothetical protein
MNNQTAIVTGSISALAQRDNISLAESFLSVDVVILADVSGSMEQHDSRGGKTRYEVMTEELSNLQKSLPGKIGVVSFDHEPRFCPGGVALFTGGGTDLRKALEFVKVADVLDMKFILISDGSPDDPAAALRVAKTFKNKIDVIFVGNEQDGSCRAFMDKLAAATGCHAVTADRAKELGASVQLLLKG